MASDTVARERAPAGPRRPSDGRRSEAWLARVPGWLATLFAVIAWICIALALVPLLRNRSEPVRAASEYLAIPIRPNLAYAAFLGLIAASLRRRTRLSWWIVVLLYFGPAFLGSLAAGFTKPVLFISAAILGVLLAVTIRSRREFTAKLPPGNGWRALVTLVAGLAIATGLGFLIVLAFPGTLRDEGDKLTWAANHVVGGLGNASALSITGHPPRVVT